MESGGIQQNQMKMQTELVHCLKGQMIFTCITTQTINSQQEKGC